MFLSDNLKPNKIPRTVPIKMKAVWGISMSIFFEKKGLQLHSDQVKKDADWRPFLLGLSD